VQRIVKILAVAAFVATVLVISSTAAFARPLRGGVLLQNEKVCGKHVENHPLAETDPRFELRPDSPLGPCWHTSPGLKKQASEVVPPT
jgi:hypothetical protein